MKCTKCGGEIILKGIKTQCPEFKKIFPCKSCGRAHGPNGVSGECAPHSDEKGNPIFWDWKKERLVKRSPVAKTRTAA